MVLTYESELKGVKFIPSALQAKPTSHQPAIRGLKAAALKQLASDRK
jgi:hypothetical protein